MREEDDTDGCCSYYRVNWSSSKSPDSAACCRLLCRNCTRGRATGLGVSSGSIEARFKTACVPSVSGIHIHLGLFPFISAHASGTGLVTLFSRCLSDYDTISSFRLGMVHIQQQFASQAALQRCKHVWVDGSLHDAEWSGA